MAGVCADRVVVVTGGGRGIGREEALAFAREGAKVVVNDLGAALDGSPDPQAGPAADVAAEIEALGGEAVANTDDIADSAGAQRLVQTAVDSFGRLDVLVNNAGIVRDRMLANMAEDEWDAVIRVHLRGTFLTMRHAAAYWRDLSKAGTPVDGRIINTSSASGLYGNVGQTNYGAAKAGIAAMTVIAATELGRYGVTVNAIAPVALTRMTEGLRERSEAERAAMDAGHVPPLVVWLGSAAANAVTGRVFNVGGGRISVAEGWVAGPEADAAGLTPAQLDDIVPDLVARARPNSDMSGRPRAAAQG